MVIRDANLGFLEGCFLKAFSFWRHFDKWSNCQFSLPHFLLSSFFKYIHVYLDMGDLHAPQSIGARMK